MAPEPRLRAGIWVAAYLARLRGAAIPAFVVARGDDTAGAVLVVVSTLDGRSVARQRSFDLMTGARAWVVLAEGTDAEVAAFKNHLRRVLLSVNPAALDRSSLRARP